MTGRRAKPLRALAALAAVAAALLAWCGPALAAEEVSVEELVSDMQRYDGREVEIVGEAVGDVMLRGGHGWVTVNDDAYALVSIEEGGAFAGYSNWGIAVWATRGQLERIQALGGYKKKGDTVRVKGVFNRACPEHGGDTDIHAVFLEVLEPGHPIPHPFAWWKLALALALAAIAGILGFVLRRRAVSSLSPARRR